MSENSTLLDRIPAIVPVTFCLHILSGVVLGISPLTMQMYFSTQTLVPDMSFIMFSILGIIDFFFLFLFFIRSWIAWAGAVVTEVFAALLLWNLIGFSQSFPYPIQIMLGILVLHLISLILIIPGIRNALGWSFKVRSV